MQVELLTKQDLIEAISPLQEKINELIKAAEANKPRKIIYKNEICKMINRGTDWWNRNLHRLPVIQSENKRWYCYQDELEKWIQEGNL